MNPIIQNLIYSPRVRDIARLRNEVFVVLYLCDGKFKGNADYDCMGTRDYVLFPDANTIIENCQRLNSASILLLHNHPYYRGPETFFIKEYSPEPSIWDIASTRIFTEMVNKAGIKVIDHLIVCGDDSYFSFVESNLM